MPADADEPVDLSPTRRRLDLTLCTIGITLTLGEVFLNRPLMVLLLELTTKGWPLLLAYAALALLVSRCPARWSIRLTLALAAAVALVALAPEPLELRHLRLTDSFMERWFF